MVQIYFLLAFVAILVALLIHARLTRKKLSETVLETFATTLVALLTREVAGEFEGPVDINLYFVQAKQIHFHYGGISFDYYFGILIAFFATFIAYGGYLYSRRYDLE